MSTLLAVCAQCTGEECPTTLADIGMILAIFVGFAILFGALALCARWIG